MSAVVDWDFRACHQAYLAPFLRAAARVADFVVHSQVLHHAPLIETPPRDAASGEHWLPTDTLQRYVDPNAWRLAGIDANATTIHLVLFVPPADVPLRVRDANGVPSATNSFIVPQWGGVVVHNVPGAAAYDLTLFNYCAFFLQKKNNNNKSFVLQPTSGVDWPTSPTAIDSDRFGARNDGVCRAAQTAVGPAYAIARATANAAACAGGTQRHCAVVSACFRLSACLWRG